MPSIHQLALGGGGAPKPGVDSLDYNYLLQKFCYFTGNNVPDRHGLRVSYGSSHHRHSQSESTPLPSPLPSPTPSPAWDATRVVDAAATATAAAADISPASLAESRAAVVAAGSKVPVPVLNDDMWSYDSSRTATTSDDSGHTTPTLSPKMQMQMRMSMSMTPAHAAHAHGTFSPFTLGSPGKRTPTQWPADHVEGFDFDVDVESTPRPRLQSTEYLVRPYRESL
ncbi:hypothetical protein FRC19_007538 [Serendipita sp. 401]|nr:hypothetical protein FRC19_007538 [Serendipita sp. 401]